MAIIDFNLVKNFILKAKYLFNRPETNEEIAERKANEDTEQYLLTQRIEYDHTIMSHDPHDSNIPSFPFQKIDEHKKQRFVYYLSELNKAQKLR
jgi:hypothetical protein